MAFRKTISQAELRDKLPERDQDSGPTYQSSRGGWFSAPEKPVPGAPKGGK
ncbi:hypothetical protein JGS39_29090 [Streptomyces sp. P01-B04]|uniref:hypothetical protein n=1 Tax=Streptomyces poriferorum TaxID=2798799 RepID=UPI001C5FC104|nr:hypothetical protein [Streptomyces poriferorum]MBW5252984.1 hypothetical protein [Streptomyces poriferorum]MBW5261104.1 hypothetical protein [Streptomyces poriferorum]